MKTTENISISGYAFTIESDAYEVLCAYLEGIKTAFATDPNADEITSDIEERIAELLREKSISGMVINIGMVEEIKTRIGDPEILAEEDASGEASEVKGADIEQKNDKRNWKNRRLYRNMEERVLGGICSGLGAYFGLDKVLFRIIFLVLFSIGFTEEGWFSIAIIAYACLWIAMPAARTAEQKREMKGKPINLNNYRSKDFNFEKEIKDIANSPAGNTAKRAGGVFLGIILLVIGIAGLFTCVLIPSVPSLVMHEFTEEIMEWGPLDPSEQFVFEMFSSFNTTWILILVMIGIMFIWFLYNGIMLMFDLKYPSWRPGLILLIAWIISILVIAGYFIKATAESLPTLIV